MRTNSRTQIGHADSAAGSEKKSSLIASAPAFEGEPARSINGGAKISEVDAVVRAGFVRKVYGILCIQLLVTFGVILAFTLAAEFAPDNVKQSISMTNCGEHCSVARSVMWASYGIAFAALLVLVCCMEQARIYPRNLIILGLFTVCESVFLGIVSAQYTAISVCMAAGATAVVVGVLTLFACKTSMDFTGIGMYLYAALSCMIIFSFIAPLMFWGLSASSAQMVQTGYACVGCLVFSVYLVYDTQLILGGEHKKFQFEVDDYVFAALNIYLDVVNLFIYILSLLGERR